MKLWTNKRRDSTDRKFCTLEGQLTSYALACGYIELHEDRSSDSTVKLEYDSNGLYHITRKDYRRKLNTSNVWCHQLREARKQFAEYVHSLYQEVSE